MLLLPLLLLLLLLGTYSSAGFRCGAVSDVESLCASYVVEASETRGSETQALTVAANSRNPTMAVRPTQLGLRSSECQAGPYETHWQRRAGCGCKRGRF